MFDHKQTLFHTVGMLSRNLTNAMRSALAPFDLHPAQFTALAEIARREGLTQSELTLRLDLEQPGVARTLAGLEAGGWIERGSAGKGRAQSLYLSERSRGVLDDAMRAVADADAKALSDLTRTERSQLMDQLAQIAEATR
jgi:DNA-binding MarR family transcriptional regulator